LETQAARAKAFAQTGLITAEYDVAKHGGEVGSIPIGQKIPANAIVTSGIVKVLAVPTSSGAATVAINLESAGDVKAATAIAALTPGLHDVTPDGTAANSFETTQERSLTVEVGTAALTAGRFLVLLSYLPGGV